MMKIKIALLMVLAASILLLGCAGKGRQQNVTEEQPEVSAPAGGQPAAPAEEPAGNASSDASELADLFQIDTDKPISDEGLDVSTPSSD